MLISGAFFFLDTLSITERVLWLKELSCRPLCAHTTRLQLPLRINYGVDQKSMRPQSE